MKNSRFDYAHGWGRRAEEAVHRWLKDNGWYVIPLADIETAKHGPRAEGRDKSITLTDILRAKGGISRLAKVKFKDSPERYRLQDDFRHGIDTPYWEQYLSLQKETNIPGDLFIIEYKDRPNSVVIQKRILAQSFDTLERALRLGDGANKLAAAQSPDFPHGGVFWSTRHFEVLGHVPDDLTYGLGDTIKQILTNAYNKKLRKVEAASANWLRSCIHPLSDEAGNPLFDGVPIVVPNHPEWNEPHGKRLRCAKPVPMGRLDRLCDEHYEPVSDRVIADYLTRILNGE